MTGTHIEDVDYEIVGADESDFKGPLVRDPDFFESNYSKLVDGHKGWLTKREKYGAKICYDRVIDWDKESRPWSPFNKTNKEDATKFANRRFFGWVKTAHGRMIASGLEYCPSCYLNRI